MNQFRCNKSKFRLELSDVLILYNGLKPKNYQQSKHTYKPMRLLHVSWKIPSLIHRFVMFKRRLEYIIDLSSFLELNVSVLLKLVHVSLWMWSQSWSFFCLKQSNFNASYCRLQEEEVDHRKLILKTKITQNSEPVESRARELQRGIKTFLLHSILELS